MSLQCVTCGGADLKFECPPTEIDRIVASQVDSVIPVVGSAVVDLLYHHFTSREDREWLDGLQGTHGSFILVTAVTHLKGLPGFKPYPLWRRLCFGSGHRVDLAITARSLIFFDPWIGREARTHVIPLDGVYGARQDLGFGSVLTLRIRSESTIELNAGYRGAIPLAQCIQSLLG